MAALCAVLMAAVPSAASWWQPTAAQGLHFQVCTQASLIHPLPRWHPVRQPGRAARHCAHRLLLAARRAQRAPCSRRGERRPARPAALSASPPACCPLPTPLRSTSWGPCSSRTKTYCQASRCESGQHTKGRGGSGGGRGRRSRLLEAHRQQRRRPPAARGARVAHIPAHTLVNRCISSTVTDLCQRWPHSTTPPRCCRETPSRNCTPTHRCTLSTAMRRLCRRWPH